jgi:hypothetical protein
LVTNLPPGMRHQTPPSRWHCWKSFSQKVLKEMLTFFADFRTF